MPTVNISIQNKIASTPSDVIICGNSDYTIHFTFDSEWNTYLNKTARFVWNNQYVDVVFSGTDCAMPVINNTNYVAVGVYAGELHTTTPALLRANKSILCGDPVHVQPTPDVYNQIMSILNGFSASVTKDGSITTITITDQHGPHTAQVSDGGVIKVNTGYGTAVLSSGDFVGVVKAISEYLLSDNRLFISKGTLENVLDNETARIDKAQTLTDAQKKQACTNINAVYDGQYELIETITLTEAVSVFERTTEPNGTVYDFNSMLLLIERPSTYSPFAYIIVRINETYIGEIAPVNRYSNARIERRNGKLLFYGQTATNRTTSSNYTGNYYDSALSTSFVSDTVNKIKFILPVGKVLETGTVIKIFAIRA